jgi:hypothetical protein
MISNLPDGFVRGGRLRQLLSPIIWETCKASSPARMLPEFIIIGAQKCGTSSLCSYLFRHPQVKPARRKEIHYFDSPEYALGTRWYKAHFPLKTGLNHGNTAGHVITGEASPYYLCYPHAPQRIHELVPRAKLIIMLRNPVDRALSHYNHQVRKGREQLSFEDAIVAEPERIKGEKERMLADPNYYSHNYWGFSYLTRGHYAEQIENWLKLFPGEQMLFISSEDFFANPKDIYHETLEFLGLENHDLPEYKKQNSGSYSNMPERTRQQLLDYFEPHNTRLENLLERNFNWIN